MIIKELEITNIRSHGHSLIKFPAGKTLLEGDIGSGKSSVLMAIEFALFGLGSDSGSSVLRLGKEEGGVRMVFDVDGLDYEVTRRLQRKSGRVQQTEGVLRSPSETLNLSPSELKEKILEVLEFNEAPDPKAQSWIYRYAVYTPQEEMKSILILAPEQRLQILRRAFRVEDYKTAATNAGEAARQVRVDASRLDGVAEGVDELRVQVEELQQEEERHKAELSELEGLVSKDEEQVRLHKEEREELQKRELSLQGTRAEREYYERLRSESASDASGLEMEAKELRRRITKAEAGFKKIVTERPPSNPLTELKRRERAVEGRVKKLTGLRAAVESKISDYDTVMSRGVCPVCDRPADAHDFDEKKTRKDVEKKHIIEELEGGESELAALRERIERTQAYLAQKNEADLKRSELSRMRKEVEKKESSKRKFEKRVSFAKSTLQLLAKKLEELEEVGEQKRAAGKSVDLAEAKLRQDGEELVKAKERLESVQKRQTQIAIEIVAKEDASSKSRRLREREIWLADYFVPTVKLIEKSVLATMNQEFDSMFKRWFGMLVSDPDKEVSVDEDFTPVVAQGGYEQDVRYLSGGERTSVALAYRLALNILAQRVSVGMKSNLLILDEPTDGFSKEQLGNVREVLDEVECQQVIIVSHDKELESFADQIFRVEKTGSESAVRLP